METAHPTRSQGLVKPKSGRFSGGLGEALRFWERRRAVYNVLLTAVTIGWLIATWPHFRMALNLLSFLRFAGLAVLANVCYCAAYLVDIPMLHSSLSVGWRRGRWILRLLGTLFAIVLANYWIADEIYGEFGK